MTSKHDDTKGIENEPTPSSSSSFSESTVSFTDTDKTFWQYIDVEKITQHTDIVKEDMLAWCVKEIVLDNPCDALERIFDHNNSSSTADSGAGTITANITKRNGLLHVVVRNSNAGNYVAFDRSTIEAIFNFKRSHSSKANQHRVSRGALGDAEKRPLTIAYALNNASGNGAADKQWNFPFIIRHNKTEHIYNS